MDNLQDFGIYMDDGTKMTVNLIACKEDAFTTELIIYDPVVNEQYSSIMSVPGLHKSALDACWKVIERVIDYVNMHNKSIVKIVDSSGVSLIDRSELETIFQEFGVDQTI